MMILQHQIKAERILSPNNFMVISSSRSPSIKDEPVEMKEEYEPSDLPLDLSVHSGRLSPGMRDSGTESDDSGGRCTPEGGDCKAYKKNLMKRYCKLPNSFVYLRRLPFLNAERLPLFLLLLLLFSAMFIGDFF